MLTSDVIYLHIQKEMRKNFIEDLVINLGGEGRNFKFKNALIEDNQIIIKHQNSVGLNFDAYIDSETFKSIIDSEVNIEWIRISEQFNNIENLLKTKSQPAWILVSVYYCCYFMANLISKLYGRCIINFSSQDLKDIYKRSNTEEILDQDLRSVLSDLSNGGNYVYLLCFYRSSENEVIKVELRKSGAEPHKFIWTNFKSIINSIVDGNCSVKVIPNIAFLQKICDSSQKKWPLPSQIRNEWNYNSTVAFASIGTSVAESFIKLLKNPNNIEGWETRMRYRSESGEEDKVVSLAYLYLILKNIIIQLLEVETLSPDEKLRNTAIKTKQTRKKRR